MTPSPFPRTPESAGSPCSHVDPSLTISDLNDLLQVKSRSESIEFLHLLVEDMRHEVGVLRTQLEESEQECTKLKAEMKKEQEGDRQRLQLLVETLSHVSKSKATLTADQMEALSAEEASNLTIATLTRKVEELSIKNTELLEEKIVLSERVHELEGENEAKQIKIGALELQFKAINKTRQKAVQRLTSSDRVDSSQGIYGRSSLMARGIGTY